MATKKTSTTDSLEDVDAVLEVTISLPPRGRSVAVYTVDRGGLPDSGKIELMDRQKRLVKRLLLDLLKGVDHGSG